MKKQIKDVKSQIKQILADAETKADALIKKGKAA